jgi:hypothetical protein
MKLSHPDHRVPPTPDRKRATDVTVELPALPAIEDVPSNARDEATALLTHYLRTAF